MAVIFNEDSRAAVRPRDYVCEDAAVTVIDHGGVIDGIERGDQSLEAGSWGYGAWRCV